MDNLNFSANSPSAPHIEGIEIIGFLGQGGMSQVYKARQMQLDRIVAVKVLSNVRGADGIKRFQNEAKITSALEHPNIVKTISFGISNDEQPVPYLVMEYLQGYSLADDLKNNGRLKLERFREVFLPVLSALGLAHSAGLVHRDIKPANIMICRNDSGAETIKLVDFGIAKIVEAQEGEVHNLTKSQAVLGSPTYMSPEQCLGKPLDGRSDLYSMACVMYESLSGEPPFSGDSVLEVMQKHSQAPPPTVSELSRKIDIRKELATVTLSGLAKDPTARPQTATEFARKLNEVLERITLDKVPRLKGESGGVLVFRWKIAIFAALAVVAILSFYLNVSRLQKSAELDLLTRNIASASAAYEKNDLGHSISSLESALVAAKALPDSKEKVSLLIAEMNLLKSLSAKQTQIGKDMLRVLVIEDAALKQILASAFKEDVNLSFYFDPVLNINLEALGKDEIRALMNLTMTFLKSVPVKPTRVQLSYIDLMCDIGLERFALGDLTIELIRSLYFRLPNLDTKEMLARRIDRSNPEESFKLYKEIIENKSSDPGLVLSSLIPMTAILMRQHDYSRAIENADRGLRMAPSGYSGIELYIHKIAALFALKNATEMHSASAKLLGVVNEQFSKRRVDQAQMYRCLICFYNTEQKDEAKKFLRALLQMQIKSNHRFCFSNVTCNELVLGRIPFETDLELRRLLEEAVEGSKLNDEHSTISVPK